MNQTIMNDLVSLSQEIIQLRDKVQRLEIFLAHKTDQVIKLEQEIERCNSLPAESE